MVWLMIAALDESGVGIRGHASAATAGWFCSHTCQL
jgi:hypothetical protein